MFILGKHHEDFVSELDRFLHDFEAQRQHSFPARQQELEKHRHIAQRRDFPIASSKDEL